jgi:hypothetical protein
MRRQKDYHCIDTRALVQPIQLVSCSNASGLQVKTHIIDHAKPKFAQFLLDQQNWSSVGRQGLSNEPVVEVLVEELSESQQLLLGKGINGARWWRLPALKVDL